nr:glgX [Aeromicrobium sp.]
NRARRERSLLTTLLLSQGVPMLLGGDEMGRTQQGNNNAYCQDNEISWVDWSMSKADSSLYEFVSALTAFRKDHPVFRRRRFFEGKPIRKGDELRDIAWFTPAGEEMQEQNWDDDFGKSIVVFLNGDAIAERDKRGERVTDDSFLMAFNAHHEDIKMTLPSQDHGTAWGLVIDSCAGTVETTPMDDVVPAGGTFTLPARSVVVLQRVTA